MDDAYTHCRSRGADGLAFVVQGEGPTALGRGGMVREREREKGRGAGRGTEIGVKERGGQGN